MALTDAFLSKNRVASVLRPGFSGDDLALVTRPEDTDTGMQGKRFRTPLCNTFKSAF
jgi:hypothetical protein